MFGFDCPTFATTVEPITVATAADFAGQVMVGTIASVRSYWAEEPRRIESEIFWSDVDYLKGAPNTADGTFRLVVPGGRVGSWEMRIAGAPLFEVGQQWVLFLLPTYRTHPVVGIDRFALRIVDGGDGPRVRSAEGAPVLGWDEQGYILTGGSESAPVASSSAASGLSGKREGRAVDLDRAMRFSDFLAALRPILAASRRYDLTEPAGQPRLGALTSQPVQRAPGAGPPLRSKAPRHPAPSREDIARPAEANR